MITTMIMMVWVIEDKEESKLIDIKMTTTKERDKEEEGKNKKTRKNKNRRRKKKKTKSRDLLMDWGAHLELLANTLEFSILLQ